MPRDGSWACKHCLGVPSQVLKRLQAIVYVCLYVYVQLRIRQLSSTPAPDPRLVREVLITRYSSTTGARLLLIYDPVLLITGLPFAVPHCTHLYTL